MKKHLSKLLAGHVLAFALLAFSCTTEDSAIDGVRNPDFLKLDSRENNPSVSGHVELDLESPDLFEKYSFTAVKLKNGNVVGQFQIYDLLDGSERLIVHGTVTCFTILADGKTAWLGGIVDRGELNGIDYAGTEANWTVVDNGEGLNEPKDEATDLTYGWAAGSGINDAHCAAGDQFTNFFGPLLRGNIQVRP